MEHPRFESSPVPPRKIRKIELNKQVNLSNTESRIFALLLDVVNHFKTGTTLRVAGGWVRDKLLNRKSSTELDIDIALDNLFGKEFAEHINKYFQQNPTKGNNNSEDGRFGVIKANPEQSKHLETATTKIYGHSIDLVNLRTEEYSQDADHRIPSSIIGTAEEDAHRRDLTINSLFYNINTKQVEDLTKKGLKDLEYGIIRTPLQPSTTFLDDPLRVLRSIRFASRFHFLLHKELCEAALFSDVATALLKKVSRERIGKEIKGMMNTNNLNEHLLPSTFSNLSETEGWNPLYAFLLIHALQLQNIIFQFPQTLLYKDGKIDTSTSESVSCEEVEKKFAFSSFRNLARFQRFIFFGVLGNSTNEHGIQELKSYLKDLPKIEKKNILFASYFLSLHKIVYPIGKPIGTVYKSNPLVKFIILDSLKHPNVEAEQVNTFVELAYKVHDFIKSLHFSRVAVGNLIRECGKDWKLLVLLALSFDLEIPVSISEKLFSQEYLRHITGSPDSPTASMDYVFDSDHLFREIFLPLSEKEQEASKLYLNFIQKVKSLNLEGAWGMKPLLNGKQVSELLHKPSGPWVKNALVALINWQLENNINYMGEGEPSSELLQKSKQFLLTLDISKFNE